MFKNDAEKSAYIKRDRMRYEKNKISSQLAIFAIICNCLYFISMYESNVGSYYYNILIGISIVYNLLFMLVVFLVSEGSKNYRIRYSYIAFVVGLLQFARLFVYPRLAHSATITQPDQSVTLVMQSSQYIWVILCLSLSGICLILSSVIGIRKCTALSAHLAQISNKESN